MRPLSLCREHLKKFILDNPELDKDKVNVARSKNEEAEMLKSWRY